MGAEKWTLIFATPICFLNRLKLKLPLAAIEDFVDAFRDARKGGHAFPFEDADIAAARIGEGFGQGIVRCIRIGGG